MIGINKAQVKLFCKTENWNETYIRPKRKCRQQDVNQYENSNKHRQPKNKNLKTPTQKPIIFRQVVGVLKKFY